MSKQFEREAIEAFKRTRQPVALTARAIALSKSVAGLSELSAVQNLRRSMFQSNEAFHDEVMDLRRSARQAAEA